MPKLDENAAIELGADLLGETIIFVVAATTITLEYMRQSRNAARAVAAEEERWRHVESQIDHLIQVIQRQNEAILVLGNTLPSKSKEEKESKNILIQAIEDAKSKMTAKPLASSES